MLPYYIISVLMPSRAFAASNRASCPPGSLFTALRVLMPSRAFAASNLSPGAVS